MGKMSEAPIGLQEQAPEPEEANPNQPDAGDMADQTKTINKRCPNCNYARFYVYETIIHEAMFCEETQCFEASGGEAGGISNVICCKCDNKKEDWEQDNIQFVD